MQSDDAILTDTLLMIARIGHKMDYIKQIRDMCDKYLGLTSIKPKQITTNINGLLKLIKQYNGGIIDGTETEQRRYGKLLYDKINKLDSVYSGKYTTEGVLEIILGIISTNQYHSHKIVGPKKIFYELAGLMQICKQEFEKEKQNKIPFIPGV